MGVFIAHPSVWWRNTKPTWFKSSTLLLSEFVLGSPEQSTRVNSLVNKYYVEGLTGQRHDRVQSESQIASVDSCFDLVGSLQHGVASCEVFSWSTEIHKPTIYMQMVMTTDESQIQIFANWPMSNTKRVTRDNRKTPDYRVVAAIRKLRKDTNCPAGKSWPNRVKMSSISDLKLLFTSLSIFGWSDLLQILRRQAAFSFAAAGAFCNIMFNCK